MIATQTRVEDLQAIADALDTLIAQHDLALDLINDLPLATRATNTLGMQLIEDRNAIAAQLRSVNAEIGRPRALRVVDAGDEGPGEAA